VSIINTIPVNVCRRYFCMIFGRSMNVSSDFSKIPKCETARKSVVWVKCFAVAPRKTPSVLN
jgi:hypothetical protein